MDEVSHFQLPLTDESLRLLLGIKAAALSSLHGHFVSPRAVSLSHLRFLLSSPFIENRSTSAEARLKTIPLTPRKPEWKCIKCENNFFFFSFLFFFFFTPHAERVSRQTLLASSRRFPSQRLVLSFHPARKFPIVFPPPLAQLRLPPHLHHTSLKFTKVE